MNDSQKLLLLARWFDVQQKAGHFHGSKSTEVQDDLRRIAKKLDNFEKPRQSWVQKLMRFMRIGKSYKSQSVAHDGKSSTKRPENYIELRRAGFVRDNNSPKDTIPLWVVYEHESASKSKILSIHNNRDEAVSAAIKEAKHRNLSAWQSCDGGVSLLLLKNEESV